MLKSFSRLNSSIGLFNSYKSTFWIKGEENKLFNKSVIGHSSIRIYGKENKVQIGKGELSKSNIRISGNSNTLLIEDNEKICNLNLHIRGVNNLVKIGKGTSIGGAKIINVGITNSITIGESCMLSDNIEIWASDSHPIYNQVTGEIINPEQSISIGDKVWIGAHVKILKGTIIGNDSVIALGTILKGWVPNNVVYGGNPNKVIKEHVFWEKMYMNQILH
jgi:acetyltransferase-like isoleucine patch superfamily enzyme